jgi:hypothetical protein
MTFARISSLIGTWRLVATRAVDDQGRPMRAPYGPKPQGIVVFGVEGRMLAVLCDGRPSLPAGETVREFNSYAGNFTFDGEQLVTLVDASSNPHWIGGEQIRVVRFEAARMILVPPPRPWQGINQHRTLEWERQST